MAYFQEKDKVFSNIRSFKFWTVGTYIGMSLLSFLLILLFAINGKSNKRDISIC